MASRVTPSGRDGSTVDTQGHPARSAAVADAARRADLRLAAVGRVRRTFLYGLWAVDRTRHQNVLSLDHADNWLHPISALTGLAIPLRLDHRHHRGGASATPTPSVHAEARKTT